MHEAFAKLATFWPGGLFSAGIPHFIERNIIPVPTSAHFIAFDADRIAPVYAIRQIHGDSGEVNVGRKDNFTDGDWRLPDELCTTEADYAETNRNFRDLGCDMKLWTLDKGHVDGSQFARDDDSSQSDIDTLAGIQPEFAQVNRNIKGPLESAIKKRVSEKPWTQVIYCAGGGWWSQEPRHGKLVNGQWIPDYLWISTFWRHKKTVEAYSWTMNNVQDRVDADLSEVTTNELEKRTGLALWRNVRASKFVKNRDRLNNKDWWKAGQPS